MNSRFLPILGFDGIQAHAVRLPDAIAAAFADLFIDHHTQRGLFQLSPRTQTPLLGRALLVVDNGGYTGHLLEVTQNFGKRVTMTEIRIRRERGTILVFRYIVGKDDYFPDALSLQLVRQRRDRQRAANVLAPGHGHGAVVQNLVRNIHVRRHASPQSKRT